MAGRRLCHSASVPNTSPIMPTGTMPRRKSFPEVLLHIANHVEKEDVARWVFLKQKVVPPRIQELCKNDLLEFFRYMEKQNIYTEENYANLIEDLDCLSLVKLKNDVRAMLCRPTSPDITSESSQLPIKQFSEMKIETTIAEVTTTESFTSEFSAAGSLRSTEPIVYQEACSQVLNVPPASQQSNQSNPDSRKRPNSQGGNVQANYDVSPNRKQCIQPAEPSFAASSPSPVTGQVGSSCAGAGGPSNNFVRPLQRPDLENPSDESFIEPGASYTSIQGNEGIGSLKSTGSHSEPLAVQPESTVGSAHQSRLRSSRAQFLNVQPESAQLLGQSSTPATNVQQESEPRPPPAKAKKAWSPESATSTQSDIKTTQSEPLAVHPESTVGSTHQSGPQGNDDDGGGLSLSSPTPQLYNAQPESTQCSGQSSTPAIDVQQESLQFMPPPVRAKRAWSSESATSSHTTQDSKIHVQRSSTAFQSYISYGSEGGASMHTLSSTQTVSSPSKSMNVDMNLLESEAWVIRETGNLHIHEVESLLSKDTLKDGIHTSRHASPEEESISSDPAPMECRPPPVNIVKKEEEKEKDEDEKEKCEKDVESEEESEEVQNLLEAGASNIKHIDEENIYHEERKEEERMEEDRREEERKEEVPDSGVGTFEASEGSWPALAVAQRLSDEKAKKEEEEAKIEYDPATGIEKTLYRRMVECPETLSSKDHDLIRQQMTQHLQKKANPAKKNEPEVPFDPDSKLTEYQKELGVPGLMGFNYIMCAPSRTGKVLTVASVCNHQRKILIMKRDPKLFKVLFVTPGDCVKERHRRAFEEVFPQGSVVALDSTSKFRAVFDQPSVNVVMLTGARLSTALDDEDLKFTDVHTLIVDDCHLVASDHPGYGGIIKHYLLEKKLILATKAPKGAWTLGKPYGGICYIIGLTPHLGAGTRLFSRDSIVEQCGLLDSKGIRRVENVNNLRDLLNSNKPPQMDMMLLTTPSSSSVKGIFRSVVEKIMSAIEEKFTIVPDTAEEGEEKKRSHPPYGTEMYAGWIVPQYNESRLCKDEEKYAPAMYLVKLNEVLMVNEDLRPKEAMAYLKEVQKLKTDQDFNGPSGSTCYRMLNEQMPELKRLAQTDHAGLTPKLMCLAQKLEKIYGDDSHALGLVICRCPAVAQYLTKVIAESNITLSKGILPRHLEEIGECEDDGEMSQRIGQQRTIIDDFERDGSVNLLVSTDFEQMDLELPDCHFVIRYNVVCEEVGTIHWSGRKKAKESQCFLVTERGSMMMRQEEDKRDALKELEKYLKVLNEMDPKNWYDIVENKQLACLRKNAQREFMVNVNRFYRRAADYTLHCRNCHKFICNAHFLLKRGTHVSCQDSSIKERFSVQSLTAPIRRTEDDTTGVLKCTGQRDGQPCQSKLGLAIDFKRLEIEEGYGLDVKAFFFSYREGQQADYVGKEFNSWDDVDFIMAEEERSERRRRSGGGGRGDDDDDDDGMDDNRGGGSADGDDSKKKESAASDGASGGARGGRTQSTEGAGRRETPMETETTTVRRHRRLNQDRNVDR